MYLGPSEQDRLLVFLAAELARRAVAEGLRLTAPEATALICDEMHRAARSGSDAERVLAAGRAAVRPGQLLDGVAGLISEIRLEVLLGDGTRLVVLRDPFGPGPAGGPGEIRSPERTLRLAPGRKRLKLKVKNVSSRQIRVSSHYPFERVNLRLEFDRAAAAGFRLDLPAGDSIRWAPGEEREVSLVRASDQADSSAGAAGQAARPDEIARLDAAAGSGDGQ